ncbi:MAG: hypothetical protein WCO94_00115 [Verrucomicrobiota bacterium]
MSRLALLLGVVLFGAGLLIGSVFSSLSGSRPDAKQTASTGLVAPVRVPRQITPAGKSDSPQSSPIAAGRVSSQPAQLFPVSNSGTVRGFAANTASQPSSLPSTSSSPHTGRAAAPPVHPTSAGSVPAASSSGASTVGATAWQATSAPAGTGHTPQRTQAVVPQTVQAIDSTAPGNSFSVAGQRVAIEGVQNSAGKTALDVAITDSGNGTSTAPASSGSPPYSSLSTAYSGLPRYQSIQRTVGFTYEQELFRSKWGWDAFNEAQKSVFQAAQ